MQNSQSMNSSNQQQMGGGDNRSYTQHESLDSSMYSTDPNSQESQENILCTDSNCEQNYDQNYDLSYDHQNYENQHSNGGKSWR